MILDGIMQQRIHKNEKAEKIIGNCGIHAFTKIRIHCMNLQYFRKY